VGNKFIKFGYVSGVLAPGYANRTDLEKFDLGLAEGVNWFVDYQGGLSTRPGTEFIDYIERSALNVTLIPFQFGFNVENTYEVLFGNGYIRFIQNGAYVLEPPRNISGIASSVVTVVSHGFSDGDWLKIYSTGLVDFEARTVVVDNATADTFTLLDPFGNNLNILGWVSGGRVSRIYTVASPFDHDAIPQIRAHQIRDTLRLTAADGSFFPYSLTRISSSNWTLTQVSFENAVPAPTGLVGSGELVSSPPGASMLYAVTAVSKNGEESLPSDSVLITGIRDFTVTTGYALVVWDAQDDVSHFNVYRSIVGRDGTLTRAQQLGFVGRAYGPTFTDNNIIPDFTISPPIRNNPFADNSITFVNVTGGGAGYTDASVVTVTDPDGTGFQGYPVVYAGEVLAVVVINGGSGYTAPVVSVSVGAGATFTTELTESSGNNPYVSTVFQQRQIYASTENQPLTIFGGKIGLFNNFDISQIITDADSYEYEIDSPVVASIKHLLPTRAGLLITTNVGMWQLSGSGEGAVTPTDALITQQSYNGVADIPPIQINEDIVILDAEHTTARMLAYSDFQKNYVSSDISILSNHYFKNDNPLTSWNFFSSPHRLIQGVRTDGKMIVGCIIKEHNIFAWTDWETKGFFRYISKLREHTLDRSYVIVERNVEGTYRKYLERFTLRTFDMVEDLNCLDSALTLGVTTPGSRVVPEMLTDIIAVLRSTSAIFTADDVGKMFRGGGGRGEVITYVSPTEVNISLDRPFTRFVHGTDRIYDLKITEWTLDTPVTQLSGLHHLEGEEVNALIDGNVFMNLTVTDGKLNFDEPFTRATVGLGFTCTGKALILNSPRAVIEDARKRLLAVGVWQNLSRGLRVGTKPTKMYELKERSNELMGAAQVLQTGLSFVSVDPIWEVEGTFYFKQENPLPVSLLGWIVDAEIGDDDD
jgi:hypothetical protein